MSKTDVAVPEPQSTAAANPPTPAVESPTPEPTHSPKSSKVHPSDVNGADEKPMPAANQPGLRRRARGVGAQVRAFPDWTSTHGIPQMGRSVSCWCLSFWALITLVAFGVLVWQVVLIFIQYYKHEVNVQITLEFEERTFPAVTLCDLNPYKKSVALKQEGISRLMDTYLYTMHKQSCSTYTNCTHTINSTLEEYMTDYGFDTLNDTAALQTRARRVLDLEAASYDLDDGKMQYADFLQGCSFNTEDCSDSDWTLFSSPSMGNCFTFNVDSTRNATRAGPIYGLRVIAKTVVDEYLLTSDTAGMKILIHDQNEYPFPDIFGYNVQVGTATSIGVTFTEISRLGSPYGQCTDDKPTGYLYDKQYSTEGCQRSSFQSKMVSDCKCYDPAYPKPDNVTVDMCTVAENYDCWSEQSNSTTSDTTCTQPCHEGSYEVTVSAAKWPSQAASTIGECIDGDYNVTCYTMYQNNGALIEVYYEKLNYQTMEESAAYTASTLLANLGGQIGLWLGMSIISIIEFVILFLQICAASCSPKIGEFMGF